MRLVVRPISLLALSFLLSGYSNVIPQVHFQQHEPIHRTMWLAWCLLVGTFAAIAGVHLAAKRIRTSASSLEVALTAASAIGAACTLFFVDESLAYVFFLAAARGTANYASTVVDDHCVRAAGIEGRTRNDRIINAFRLIGMLSAPVFFTSMKDHSQLVLIVLFVLAIAGFSGVLFRSSQHGEGRLSSRNEPLTRQDRRMIAYGVFLYAALWLFAANIIYLLRDVAKVDEPERRGGVVILFVYVSALVVAGALPSIVLRTSRRNWMILSMLTIACGVLAVAIPFEDRWPIVLVVAITTGSSFGLFLIVLRDHMTRAVVEHGRGSWMGVSNNLANHGSLVAFGAMALLATLGTGWVVTLSAVAVLAISGIPFAMKIDHNKR